MRAPPVWRNCVCRVMGVAGEEGATGGDGWSGLRKRECRGKARHPRSVVQGSRPER